MLAVAAPGRLQHARLAAAEVPRPRAGELGGPEGRDAHGSDAPPHDGAGRRGRHRGPGGRADRAGRHGARGPEARDRGRGAAILERRLEELKAGTAQRRRRTIAGDARSASGGPRTGASTGSGRRKEVHDLVRAVTHPYPGRLHRRLRRQDLHLATRLPGLAAHDTFPGQVRAEERTALRRPAGTTATSSSCASSRRASEEMDAARLHRARGRPR